MIEKLVRRLFQLILMLFFLTNALVFLYRFIPVPGTPLMLIRAIEYSGHSYPFQYQWVGAREISEYAYLAAIVSEDQNFFKHSGFDFKAMKKAIENNKKGKRLRGASTITQQVAKNLFLWPKRSWIRKGLEAYFTVLIEFYWPKKRILHTYLNVVETGKHIYGIEAAARHYFKKPAKNLTASEASQIIAILPNPRKWRAQPPGPYVSRRAQWIQHQMKLFGGLQYLYLNDCCY